MHEIYKLRQEPFESLESIHFGISNVALKSIRLIFKPTPYIKITIQLYGSLVENLNLYSMVHIIEPEGKLEKLR